MKTIGLLGGMSWESTQTYYRLINEGVKAKLGGLHSAKLVLVSVDFAEIKALQYQGDWDAAGAALATAAQQVEAAGADLLLLCTNTMHKVAPQIEAALKIPLLHLADATAERIKERGLKKVGLLGTKFTMTQDFYKARLEHHHLDVIVPNEQDRDTIHRIIYDELCLGNIREDSRQDYLRIIQTLQTQGAAGIIAGCTEIGLLVQQKHIALPLFDTAAIHAELAVKKALT